MKATAQLLAIFVLCTLSVTSGILLADIVSDDISDVIEYLAGIQPNLK